MADNQGQAPQAEPATPVKTVAETHREKRDSTFKARQAKAAKRFAARNGTPDEPEGKTEERPAEEPAAKPEASTEDKPPDPKKGDVDKRHAIAERREKRVQAREAKTKEREDKLSRAEHNLQTRYGDPDAARKAYEAGNHYEAAKYVQRIFGDDYATITQKIARATAGLSPEKMKELEERDAFTREKRQWEADKKKREEEQTAGATREKAVAAVSAKCKGHDALKLKNGGELVLRVLEKHWDRDHFTISFKDAADLVVSEKLAEAEALGLKRHTAALVEEKPETAPPTKREPRHKPPVVEEKRPGRLSFEERHAQAGRLLAKRRAQ